MLSDKQKEAFSILERGKEISTVLYGGAAGGGKSVLLAEWQAARRVLNPETSGLIGRDTLINLKKTTLVTFFRVWKKHWQNNPWGVTMKPNFQENTLNFSNGSIIYLKGLAYNSSDPEGTDFGSLELTDAAIDEANGCSEKYVNITESRIRYNLIDGRSPMLLLANPGYDWVRNRFWKDAKGNRIVLKPHEAFIFAKLTDNPDPIFQENYRRQLEKLPPYDRDRLLYGDWDAVRSADNPFLHAFDESRHVGIAEYNPELPILCVIDFNINPFCAIFAQKHGNKAWIYDEVAIDKGDLFKMADAIRARIPEGKKTMLRIAGDAMGNRGEVGVRDNHSNYSQLLTMLGLHYTQLVLKPNPTHKNSRADCNAALVQKEITISHKCVNLIADCKLVECDHDGQIVKKNRDRMEQRADFLDDFRYFVNAFLK